MHAVAVGLRRRRQVRQVARRALQQAHRHHRLLGLDHQPPLAGAVPQPAFEPRAARFQLPRGKRPRSARSDLQTDFAESRRTPVVDPPNRYGGLFRTEIHQPQNADLALIAAGVEDRYAAVPCLHCGDVVHGGHEPVARAHVRQYVDVQIAREIQAPVTVASAGAARQPGIRMAGLEVVRVEVGRLEPIDRQGQWVESPTAIVYRKDSNLAGPVRTVDHPHETLPQWVRGRGEHEDPALNVPMRIDRRCLARPGNTARKNQRRSRQPAKQTASQAICRFATRRKTSHRPKPFSAEHAGPAKCQHASI
ncbi:MAG: hypothetical protein OXU72_14250 [Gammaproteobacteria bacterium]|nr:hypothetical protein [Gammaproteobacteria bacterium]